jgi:hypothetical protein
MPWNCEDNSTLRERSRLKRNTTAAAKPDAEEDDTSTYTAIVLALDRFPEAKRAVIRALRRRCGLPEDDDEILPECLA